MNDFNRVLWNSFIALHITACASVYSQDHAPRESLLERIPLVYRPDIQQGNVLTQELVNQLKPGLSKRQVRFLMGTPMLVDVFHQDRWDYLYAFTAGWGTPRIKKLALHFQNDSLARIEGDLTPDPNAPTVVPKTETVVEVPDFEDPNAGIIEQAVGGVKKIWKNSSAPTATSP